MDLNLLCIIGKKLIGAIKKIHTLGVCHRDVKPENIIISDEKEIMLIDFGLATGIKNNDILNYYCGTKKYSSANWHQFTKVEQNQALDNRIPGKWDDLESALYTLIFCWTGHLDWEGSSLYYAKMKLLQNPSYLPLPLQRMASYIYNNYYVNLNDINYMELETIFIHDKEEF